MRRGRVARSRATAVLVLIIGSFTVVAQRPAPAGEWREYYGNVSATKYSPLDQITSANVANLRVAWRWASPDRPIHESNPAWRPGRNEDTPLMANGSLYTVTQLGLVAALNPGTGEQLWVYDPASYKAGRPNNVGFVNRGLAYWTDGRVERLLIGTHDAYVIALDARTGKPVPTFGTGGKVDLIDGLPRAVRALNIAARRPLIAGDIVVVGSSVSDPLRNKDSSPPGYVQAFDVRTGKKLWTFHTIPQPGEVGYDTWLEGSAEFAGGANVWGGMVYDPQLDYVYMAGSTPSSDFYGGHRPGDNLFAETLICVEAKTGKRVWHFQAVHHGLWDYDFPTPPILGDITVSGRRVKAVMQVSKQAFTYVLDRQTGHPVWPVEERPVPQSRVPRERTSPTQPFPTKPPAFDLQGTTEDNLMDYTPDLKRRALDQLKNYEYGPLFTPPSEKGTLMLPGWFGGANWGGAGFDPETGVLYVFSRMFPVVLRVTPGDPQLTDLLYRTGGSGPSTEQAVIDGLPLFKPPYSRITAIDMNRGEHLWMSPVGNGPRHHPLLKDLQLPPLGDQIHMGGVLITKTLVFLGVTHLIWSGALSPPAWSQWGDPNAERKVIYVFDKRAGKLRHIIESDNLSVAAPMTYLYRGRQYIVAATGGGDFASELVAFAAPAGTTN